jgi:hypothetical protein
MKGTPEKTLDGWVIPVGEGIVTRITIDYQFGIMIFVDTRRSIQVNIEGRFTYYDGTESESVNWQLPAELGRFLTLHNEVVSGLRVSNEGELTLEFVDGRRIDVPPDPNFEAFEVRADTSGELDGFRFIGMPGGGVAEWT